MPRKPMTTRQATAEEILKASLDGMTEISEVQIRHAHNQVVRNCRDRRAAHGDAWHGVDPDLPPLMHAAWKGDRRRLLEPPPYKDMRKAAGTVTGATERRKKPTKPKNNPVVVHPGYEWGTRALTVHRPEVTDDQKTIKAAYLSRVSGMRAGLFPTDIGVANVSYLQGRVQRATAQIDELRSEQRQAPCPVIVHAPVIVEVRDALTRKPRPRRIESWLMVDITFDPDLGEFLVGLPSGTELEYVDLTIAPSESLKPEGEARIRDALLLAVGNGILVDEDREEIRNEGHMTRLFARYWETQCPGMNNFKSFNAMIVSLLATEAAGTITQGMSRRVGIPSEDPMSSHDDDSLNNFGLTQMDQLMHLYLDHPRRRRADGINLNIS